MLGAIADDVTGAVDLASNLAARGFRTSLVFGVPAPADVDVSRDAVVVALKSRTAPVSDAVRDSTRALDALRVAGATKIYVKYCSTFDSTPDGNIGPVCDVAVERMDAGPTVVVPSFPANGRTVYRGYLFVGDVLLNESSLADHPLTPMTDANIVRVLQRQTDGAVALVPLETVREGARAVRTALDRLRQRSVRYAVTDAVDDADLTVIAEATATDALVTGGSGLALGMRGPASLEAFAAPDGVLAGPRVVLAGSASAATRAQLSYAEANGGRIIRLHIDRDDGVARALAQAFEHIDADPDAVLIVAPPTTHGRIDPSDAARLEQALTTLASELVQRGVRRLIVAGGETSGAVVSGLGVRALALLRPIDPGVAWTLADVPQNSADGVATTADPVALALKSGNFGRESFFIDAWRYLA